MFRRLLPLVILLFLTSQLTLAQEQASLPFSAKLVRIVKAAVTGNLPADYAERQELDDKIAGVVRLTDANFAEKVIGGEKDDVWVVMIHENTAVGASTAFYDAHTNATAAFAKLIDGDDRREDNGKRVIFARMLYDSEWKTCTRWLVFRPPRLVFVTDNGATLRFLSPPQIKADGERWANWIKSGKWILMEPWKSGLGPDGSRAWIIESYIQFFEFTSPHVVNIPSIVWLFLTGALGKLVMDWLHPAACPPEAYETTNSARPRRRTRNPTDAEAETRTRTANPVSTGTLSVNVQERR